MEDNDDSRDGGPPSRPDSLLPYDAWTEEALRHVVVRALAHVGEQPTLVEWDVDLPPLAVLIDEARLATEAISRAQGAAEDGDEEP